jgi:hypothetical protein
MSSPPADQTPVMKEVLEALKTIQINQAHLSSSVDAISGRVNVLSGMKEVHDVAKADSSSTKESKAVPSHDESHSHDDAKIPESPSLPATHVNGDSHSRKSSTGGTSRIILT